MSAWVIAAKDLRLVARDRAALAFVVIVPLAVITIVAESLVGSDASSILLPVVNEDEGPVAELLIESLERHARVEVVSRARAEALVADENRAAAALVLPPRLSKSYLAGRPSRLELLTDPAAGVLVDAVQALLLAAERDAAALADPLYEELLVLEEHNLTGSRGTIPVFEQNVPGFGVMFVLMSVLFGVAFGLRDEVDGGTLTRLRAAPLSREQLLAGKLLARFLLGTGQLLLLFAFGHAMWGLSLGPSLGTLLLVCVASVWCLTGFSLVVAALARSREQIIPLGLTVVMIVCALGGCWWPLYQQPAWLRGVAELTPTAWVMRGIHDLILRERGLAELWPVLGVLLAYGALGGALGARLYRLEPRGA